jgi:hypothetical protein
MGFLNVLRVFCLAVLVAGCTSARKEPPKATGSPAESATPDTVLDAPPTSTFVSVPSYQVVARNRYGDGVDFIFNDSRSYVICIAGRGRFKSPFPKAASPLRFFVYDLTSDQVVFEESLDNARVSWETETLVKVSVTPGMVQIEKPKEYGYRYDVVAREKSPLQ